ncbi:hypothetical protein Tco_1067077 [Tanacetum coccineum]|uniref:Uncharacterized protein n=1 Tax=Tanacetum coccineum TaxID=301880 RepID=A0ABQ5HCH3_9ASTR
MRHSKISNDNHQLFNNHNHDLKNHNHQQKKTVGANEWRKGPRWIWKRPTRRKSRPVSVHVGHVKKKFCYVSVGSKILRTATPKPTKTRIRFRDMQDFNNSTFQGTLTKNMLTGKWTRVNGDCQKFNAIYKHFERKSRENEADHIETGKINFASQSKGRKFC